MMILARTKKRVRREGEVGAGYTRNSLRSFWHIHRPIPIRFATRVLGLRILLRASPRDPTGAVKWQGQRRQNIAEGCSSKLLSQEKEIIRQQAHLAGLTVSEYIRKCALNRPIRSRVSREVAAELSKLFGLQKHLLMEIKNLPNEEELRRELNSVLLELHTALATFNKNTAE